MAIEHSLWVEKYRPLELENYIGNEHLKSKVKVYLESGDMPHLLLFGRAGTGKTTLAKMLVNSIDCDYLYINASDENNVETVRTKVKNFASTIGFKDMPIAIVTLCFMPPLNSCGNLFPRPGSRPTDSNNFPTISCFSVFDIEDLFRKFPKLSNSILILFISDCSSNMFANLT